jgi:hypothetical protein
MELEVYDAARAAVARRGFHPRLETQVALFVCTAKTTNALFLAATTLAPVTTPAQAFLHAQYFHEVQAVTLLGRVTRWAVDPLLYARAAGLTAPIWADGLGTRLTAAVSPRAFYAGLALGHALLSAIRLTPVIPAGADDRHPFAVALRRIERDDGRMLQTQIRLLRTAGETLSLPEREEIIETRRRLVEAAFAGLLAWIVQDSDEAPAPTAGG